MTKPEEKGSRDTGSDLPSGGPADRPSGAYKGDESVPQYGEAEKPDFETGFTTEPPKDTEPEVPPYEGRKTSADAGESTEKGGARTGGATAPTTDPDPKGDTAGQSTASPAQEQPAASGSESDSDDDMVGPAHTPGTGRGEQKR
jgi:hypothetical protein